MSKSLESLADELIANINSEKDDIFKSIVVVFPNRIAISWFKDYWLKKENGRILMNVVLSTISETYQRVLRTNNKDANGERCYIRAVGDELVSYIIKYLIKNKNNSFIKEYLENDTNNNKLYDAANNLARLFIEYGQDEAIELDSINQNDESIKSMLKDIAVELYNDNIIIPGLNKIVIDEEELTDGKLLLIKNDLDDIYFFNCEGIHKAYDTFIEKYKMIYQNAKSYKYETPDCKPKKVTISLAPSKIKEVEVLHSNISKLLLEEDAKLSDILVYAPNISEYENIIAMVFNQSMDYPNIPYKIICSNSKESDIQNALDILLAVGEKDYFTRKDFISLLEIETIQNAFGITEDRDVFLYAIKNMNVFRNYTNFDHWEYAKRRIVASKILDVNSGETIQLAGEAVLPYDAIGIDDQVISHFVTIIDNLKSWNNCFKSIKSKVYLNKDDIIALTDELNKWFTYSEDEGRAVDKAYKNVLRTMRSWQDLIERDNFDLPYSILFNQIRGVAVDKEPTEGEAFLSGVTFTSLTPSLVLHAKYVFVLGASQDLPRRYVKSELDYRNNNEYDKTNIERETFIKAYKNSENFYMSYVYIDLVTGEEHFLTNFSTDIIGDIKSDSFGLSDVESIGDVINKKTKDCLNTCVEIHDDVLGDYTVAKYGIDELRPANELFTKRSLTNKKYATGINNDSNTTSGVKPKEPISQRPLPRAMKAKSFEDYLTEPFSAQVNELFGMSDDVSDEIADEYENLSPSPLEKFQIIKLLIEKAIEQGSNDLESVKDDVKKELDLQHVLPDASDGVKTISINDAILFAEPIYSKMLEIGGFEKIKLEPVKLEYMDNGSSVSWQFIPKDNIYRSINEDKRYYVELKKFAEASKGKLKDKTKYIRLYVFALADIASINGGDEEYNICLVNTVNCEFKLSPSKARFLLNGIYKEINDYSDVKPFTINLKESATLYDLIDKLKTDCWKYFNESGIFDLYRDLGYDYSDFNNQFLEKKAKMEGLMVFLNDETNEEEGGNEDA